MRMPQSDKCIKILHAKLNIAKPVFSFSLLQNKTPAIKNYRRFVFHLYMKRISLSSEAV